MNDTKYPLFKNNYDSFLDGIIIAILNENSAAEVQNAESHAEKKHESDQLFVSNFEKPGNEFRKESIQKFETVSFDIIKPKNKQTEENSSHNNRSSISWFTLAVPLAAVLIIVLAFVLIMIHRRKETIPAESYVIQESAVVTADDSENEGTGTTSDDSENEGIETTTDDSSNSMDNSKMPQDVEKKPTNIKSSDDSRKVASPEESSSSDADQSSEENSTEASPEESSSSDADQSSGENETEASPEESSSSNADQSSEEYSTEKSTDNSSLSDANQSPENEEPSPSTGVP